MTSARKSIPRHSRQIYNKKAMVLCNILLTLSLLMYAEAVKNCTVTVGTYRDCLCGLMRRDIETQCHNELTYFQPILTQENLSCPFECLNNGIPFENGCHCKKAHGHCCETPTFCGSVHLTPTGEIKSPGFDVFYPPSYLANEDCIWRISTDENRQIALGLVNDQFDIQEGRIIYACDRDSLTVYNGNSDKAQILGNFCGRAFGARAFRTIYSSGPHLYIKFKTDDKVERKGFHLQYRTFAKGKKCGPRTKFSLPTGLITSPQYPMNYRPRESCEYEIEVKPSHDVLLRTSDMNIPSRDPNCANWREDRIQVLVKSNSSNLYNEVATYCGYDPYPILPIRGASTVLIKFTSNDVREGRFLLQYEQVPI